MGYVGITNKGKVFIRGRCRAKGDRFKGSSNYPLGRSNITKNTVFVANVFENNKKITTNDVLADNIIKWVEEYSSIYDLDANIIAAQMYAESGYNLWVYSNGGKNGSSAMGISQFIDVSLYDVIFKNKREFANEIITLKNGLTGDFESITTLVPFYSNIDNSIESTNETDKLAKENRGILFQNIIDNPKIMIKAQCCLMSKIGQNNNNLASSSLFAYNRGSSLKSKSYNEIIDTARKKNYHIDEGIKYVDKIFKLLAGTYGQGIPIGEGFGKPYDEANVDLDIEANKNLTNSILLSNGIKNKNKNENGEYALYDNGTIIQYAKIDQIDGVNVLLEHKERIVNMINAAKNDNITLVLNEGFRTFDEQLAIRKKNVLDKSKSSDINFLLNASSNYFFPETGRPGFSNHQDGTAYDFSVTDKPEVYKWLIENAHKFGFMRTVPSERWHWEYRALELNPFKFVAYTHPTWDGKSDLLKSQLPVPV